MLIKSLATNSKLERITRIYELLSKSDGMSISELANTLNVSSKTIQRDLHETLAGAGAVCDGRKWKIDGSMAKDDLKNDEKIILGILDELAKSAGRQFYLKAHNLISQISSNLNHPIYANLNIEALNPENLATFELLEDAIKNKAIIRCAYSKGRFELKPLKLVFFDGFWYLLAFDTKENDTFKKFHLKTLKSIEVTTNSFEKPQELEERLSNANSIWFSLGAEPFTVRLFLSKRAVALFERKPLKSQSFSARYPDGSAEITITATHLMEILPIVLLHIPLVKIAEPQWLAKQLEDMLKEFLDKP